MNTAVDKAQRKRILIADDDELFRRALHDLLVAEGYQVLAASGGKSAQSLIGVEKLDLVISDIRMPQGNGIELTHFVKRTFRRLPVILMTGFAEVSASDEARAIGADEFLPKPFNRSDLLEILQTLFSADDPAGRQEALDDEFCKISIEDFVSGRDTQCDIYIRLSAQKYVKIAREGEGMEPGKITAYRDKNIRFLYMRKEDFQKYIGFSLSLVEKVKSSGRISKVRKLNFLKHTGEIILEQLHLEGVDEAGFDNARAVVESTVSILSDDRDAMNLLELLNSHADALYSHSLGVSLYAAMMARQLRWTNPTNLFKVAVGGLLHDIGKKEIDKAILFKPRGEMSVEEVKIYESHTMRGVEILGRLRTIPSDVLQIVLQHHENCLGLGYPSKLKKNHIHPMARLVAVANEFCNLVLDHPNSPRMKPVDAIQRMLELCVATLDPAPFAALLGIFNLTPPAALTDPRKKS